MKKIVIVTLALLMNVCAWANEPMWNQYGKIFKVKGGVGIEQFVEAILDTKKGDWDHEATYDKKNGFFHYFEEGAGHIEYFVAYWNRKDGKKLVMMSYDTSDFTPKPVAPKSSPWGYSHAWKAEVGPDDEPCYILTETGFRAYLYNEAKQQLEPLQTPPVNGWDGPSKGHFQLRLPRSGKDITVREEKTMNNYVYHWLKWNGTTFDFVKGGNAAFDMYIVGDDNIYNAPNGKVACKLPNKGEFSVVFDRIENGWCHIVGDTAYENEQAEDHRLTGSSNGYWIKSSSLCATGMGDGSVTLYASPDKKAKVVVKTDDWTEFNPIEIRGEWLKVRVKKTNKEGWIHGDDICSNPLTNCC